MVLSMLLECRFLCWQRVVSAIWKAGVMDFKLDFVREFIFGVNLNLEQWGYGVEVVTRLYYGGGEFLSFVLTREFWLR